MTPDITQLQTFRKDVLLGKPSSPDHLQMLSLAAALDKFERLPTPKAASASLPVLRSATYPSASTRRSMIRLLSGREGNVSDSMAAAIPQILQQHGLALHPFDFARLEDFVSRHLERLSPDAREWLRLIRPERKEADDPYLDGPISEEHLIQASKAQRIQYLREMRARDAARARELIAGMMPSETAEMRLRLLKIIDDTPTADDQPFLETLVKDRAPTVEEGALLRLEELTRMGSDVQDTLITVLSEKTLPIPELNSAVHARRGFNVIATANNRDKGVNELSSALKRRFNVVVLPLPNTIDEETAIVVKRVNEIGAGLQLPTISPVDKEIARVVTIFREMRDGQTLNGKQKLKSPSGTLSTAEAISVGVGAWAEAAHFGSGTIDATSLSANIVGAVVKDPVQDRIVMQEYLESVVRERSGWRDLYDAIREVM